MSTSNGLSKPVSFVLGLLMALSGGYLLLSHITVSHMFSFGYPLYHLPFGPRWGLTTGTMLIPLVAGIGFIFYNAKSMFGWVLAGGTLAAIVFGVLMSLTITMRAMSLLDMLLLLVLVGGGLGLVAKARIR
jgi:hypothetical protein